MRPTRAAPTPPLTRPLDIPESGCPCQPPIEERRERDYERHLRAQLGAVTATLLHCLDRLDGENDLRHSARSAKVMRKAATCSGDDDDEASSSTIDDEKEAAELAAAGAGEGSSLRVSVFTLDDLE